MRGLQLFALGYVLNLVRFSVPLLVSGDPHAIDVFGGTWWGPLFEIDILQLAGLSLIVLGPVKRYVRGPGPRPGAGGGGGDRLAAPVGSRRRERRPRPAVGARRVGVVPALPLARLPAARPRARRVHRPGDLRASADAGLGARGGCAALAGVALLAFAPGPGGILAFGDYYRSGLPVQLLLAGFVLLWLPLLWWLDRRLSWVLVPRYLTSLSRTITAVYLIQWVLIGWLAIVFGVFDLASWQAALLGGARPRRQPPSGARLRAPARETAGPHAAGPGGGPITGRRLACAALAAQRPRGVP